jgi:D-alanyl-D-alanine dipeptidase
MANEEEELDEGSEDQDDLDAVEIRDDGEPLVDFVAACPELVFAPTHPVFEFPRVHLLRESVARMLCEAARALQEIDPSLRLQIVEGFRPAPVQSAMYKHALEEAKKQLGEGAGAEKLARHAGRYAAPPNAITPPPHLTGGAVDLEIIDSGGERLDFSSPFEIKDPRQAAMHARGLSAEAEKNRALLRQVLEPTGLTSYADEWWHWSYGDNGWALRTGAPHALYGKIEMPHDADWVGDKNKLPREERGEFEA